MHKIKLIVHNMKFIKALPFYSKLGEDYLDCGLWESDTNLCELIEEGNCTKNSTEYFGTTDSLEPKFCFKHFRLTVVSGDGITNYKLVSAKEVEQELLLAKSKQTI